METSTVTSPAPAVATDSFEAYLVLTDPQLLDDGYLRFSVVICKATSSTRIMTVKGWRVGKGNLLPPASRHKNSYLPIADIPSKYCDLFSAMLAVWKDVYPTVEFPIPDDGEPLGAAK